MTPYVPEWKREDSLTRTMKESEMIAYYKSTAVLGDCRFALRERSTPMPEPLRAEWTALYLSIGKKEKPIHRAERNPSA